VCEWLGSGAGPISLLSLAASHPARLSPACYSPATTAANRMCINIKEREKKAEMAAGGASIAVSNQVGYYVP